MTDIPDRTTISLDREVYSRMQLAMDAYNVFEQSNGRPRKTRKQFCDHVFSAGLSTVVPDDIYRILNIHRIHSE